MLDTHCDDFCKLNDKAVLTEKISEQWQ